MLLLNLVNTRFDTIAKHLNGEVLHLPESLFVGRFVLQHVSEEDESGLLHYQERPADSVHLTSIRIALALDP